MYILLDIFSPLALALSGREDMRDLMRELGWEVTFTDAQLTTLNAVLGIADDIEAIAKVARAMGKDGLHGDAVEEIIRAAERVFETLATLRNVTLSDLKGLPAPFSKPATWGELALRLPDYLLLRWLDAYLEPLAEVLRLFGMILPVPGSGPARERINWDALPQLLSDPAGQLRETYDWGGTFDHVRLFERLIALALGLGIRPLSGPVLPEIKAGWGGAGNSAGARQLEAPLLRFADPSGLASFRTDLVVAPAAERGKIAGVQLTNLTSGSLAGHLDLGGGWGFDAEASGDLNNALALRLMPSGLEFLTDLTGAAAAAEMRLSYTPEAPMVLVGGPEAARLELAQIEASVSADVAPGASEFRIGATTQGEVPGLTLVIAPGEGDGFISDILGADDLAITADIGASWSSTHGFKFDGGLGFDVDVPLDLTLGPIRLDALHLSLFAGTEGGELEAAVTGALTIGVATAVVEEVGLRATLGPTPEGETSPFGALKPTLRFKPPKGMGLAIDAAGIVTGGGYLSHDPDLAEYAGVADIGFASLKLSAIGLLTTRMPDGADGWSLFLSVFSGFPPLPLGFGFTLNGVGGLVGLHRTFDDEVLRARMLSGALDSIMFPQDPVAGAPQILSDIRAVFPPSQDQFVFGAMCQIGWGLPTVLTLDLGVIVELPDPIKIVLLGQLNMALPKPVKTIIELNMDVFGVFDLTEGTMALDATIRDSHILHLMTLTGDMAFRASFDEAPQMLMSVGGYHPKFTPPADVPKLRRLKSALPLGKNASVDLSCYVAITSNTFQAGGRLDVWVKVIGFTAEGWFGFDALIQFSPFGFDFIVSFGVTVRTRKITLMGVDVTCTIVGPGPWEIDGTARFEILKAKKKITIDLEVGRKKTIKLPSYDVAALLSEALSDPGAWSVEAASGGAAGVVLSEAGEGRVHPAGFIVVTQNLAPFGATLDKFGAGTITGPKRFDLTAAYLGGARAQTTPREDWFAPAEFFEMKDLARLKASSFERHEAGLTLASTAEAAGPVAERVLAYEEITLDPVRNLTSRRDPRDEPPLTRAPNRVPGNVVPVVPKGQFTLKDAPARADGLRRRG